MSRRERPSTGSSGERWRQCDSTRFDEMRASMSFHWLAMLCVDDSDVIDLMVILMFCVRRAGGGRVVKCPDGALYSPGVVGKCQRNRPILITFVDFLRGKK